MMRYMMLIYSREGAELSAEESARVYAGHVSVMQDAAAKGVLVGADPLESIASATTVRMRDGKMLATDGPFAETKEQLAGYYIIECANLEEAKQWASRMPTSCYGDSGCVEIRPLRSIGQDA